MLQTSLFRVYSIGIVAVNKAISSKTAMVTPLEITTHLDGEIASTPTELEQQGVDDLDQPYTVAVTIDNAIPCEWLGQTNRATAPDVRRGERVLIWQYGDDDETFYWTSLGMDDNLRRLETVRFTFSDTPDESEMEINADNSYWLEVSTHTKTVTFQTSKANGEPFEYTMQFNCDEGVVTLADDVDNWWELNSRDTIIKMHNANGTWISLDKNDFLGNVVDDMIFKVGRDFNFNVGRNVNWTIGGDWTDNIGGKVVWDVKADITFTASKMTINNDTQINGALAVTGPITSDTSVGAPAIDGGSVTGGSVSGGSVSSDTPFIAPGGVWHKH